MIAYGDGPKPITTIFKWGMNIHYPAILVPGTRVLAHRWLVYISRRRGNYPKMVWMKIRGPPKYKVVPP